MHFLWSLYDIKHTKLSLLCRGVHVPVSLLSHPPWCCFCHLPGESIRLHAVKSRSHPCCVDGLALNLTWEMFQITPSSNLQLEQLGCNTKLLSVLALMEPVLLQWEWSHGPSAHWGFTDLPPFVSDPSFVAQGEERIRTVIFICKMDKSIPAAQQRYNLLKGKIIKPQRETGLLNSTGVQRELFCQAPLCSQLIPDSQSSLGAGEDSTF